MPDFDDIQKEAKDHGKLVDEGVAEVQKDADKTDGGIDHSLTDEAAQGIDKEVGDAPGSGQPGR